MNFLNKAYSKYSADNKIWKSSLFSAVVVLLIFLLFQPFGFRDKATELKSLLYPGYAVLTFIYSYIVFYIVRRLLKSKKTWTIKDEIINFLIGILIFTIAIHLFTFWVSGDMPLTLHWYFKLFYHVASLFLFIGIIEFFYYNNKSARFTNEKLSSQYETTKQKSDQFTKQNKDVITISLEKEQIEVNRNKLLYIKSVGNYLEFYLVEPNGKINKITKRGRLHKAGKDLARFIEFFRCHRAFIINLKQAVQLKGNIKNARVVFDCAVEDIPVSRSNYSTLKEQMEKITLG